MPRVVVAPDAATRLAVAAEWLAAQPLDAEVLVVGPTWEACDDLVRGAVVQARARFGTVRLTLDRLAARLAAPVLAADGRVPAGGLSVTAVAARAVHLLLAEGALRYFAPVAGRPGFPAAVARTLEELRMNGVGPAALQEHLFEESAPPRATLDESVTLRSWPGEAREAVEIARAVQSEGARGIPFDRMAVLLRSPTDYREHLEEAFRRAAIPAFFARGTRRPDPGGRALLALLACAAEKLSARRFAEYLSLAQVPDPDRPADPEPRWVPPEPDLLPTAPATEPLDDQLPPDPDSAAVVAGSLRAPWRWERLLVDSSVIGGKERWARRRAGLERELGLRRAASAGGVEHRPAA